MTNSGPKSIKNCVMPPPAPGSAASTIRLINPVSIKAEPFEVRSGMLNPTCNEWNPRVSGFAASPQDKVKQLKTRTYPRLGPLKVSENDRLPYPAHAVKVKVKVVIGRQDPGEHLPRHEQVPEVTSRVTPADKTLTL